MTEVSDAGVGLMESLGRERCVLGPARGEWALSVELHVCYVTALGSGAYIMQKKHIVGSSTDVMPLLCGDSL